MPKSDSPKSGRPTKMSKETVDKLEHAFALGCSDEEACLYADITKPTLYSYQEKNPEFLSRKKLLKTRPVLEARDSVQRHMKKDGSLALRFLERKKKDEFALRSEHTGKDGEELKAPSIVIYKPQKLADDYDEDKK